MANDILNSFRIALGFDVDTSSRTTALKSIADYEKAVKDAEKRIEDARWAGAKSEEEIAKLTREANLKEARAALASAQDREKAEKEQAKKRDERGKEFVAGLNKMALAATAMATAIGYAVNRVAQSFDHLGFVSARTGASVQGLNSLSYAFKQVGGTSQQAVGAVEKFAQALRGNDGLKGMLKGLGVDTTKDTADVYLSSVEALSKHGYQVGSREAALFGISEEDFKLTTDYLGKIKEFRDEYNRTTRSLGIDSGKAAEASMAFQRSLNKLTATASALYDKLMVSLAPALETIVKRFNDWIAANPEKVNKILDDITKALVWLAEKAKDFGEWMVGTGGDELLKRWDQFGQRVERVAVNIAKIVDGAAKLVGFFERLSGTNTALGSQSRTIAALDQIQGDDRSWWQRHAPRFLGGRDAPSGGTARLGRLAQNANAQSIIGELRQAGYNNNAIAAIVGSMQTESTFNPGASNNQSGGHTGLWQWDRNRWPKIAKWIKDQGGDPMDARWQTRAWVAEHNARPGDPIYDSSQTQRGGAILRGNPSLNDAIHGVQMSERFGVGEEGGRAANARGWLPHVSAPTAAPVRSMTPGGFDPNNIDPTNLMQPAPAAGAVTNNSSSTSRVVHQTFHNTTTITGADRPQESAKIMESAFGRMHGLALANAQSATV